MESEVLKTETNPGIIGRVANGNMRRPWNTPVLRPFRVSDTKGGPNALNDPDGEEGYTS